MLSLIAVENAQGQYEWRHGEKVFFKTDNGVVLHFGHPFPSGTLYFDDELHVAKEFKIFLYAPGTQLVDETDSAKLRRNPVYSAVDYDDSIPRKDIEV